MKLVLRSLILDIQFLTLDLRMSEKIEFLCKKYIALTRNFLFSVPNNPRVTLFQEEFYYDDKFGIAYLQSLYIDNAFLSKFISKDAVIIDVGANIGQFNFFSKKYLHAKTIYSFEPIKKTFLILKKNVSNHVFNVAISKKKILHLFTPASVSLMASNFPYTNDDQEEIVQGVSLDTYIKKLQIKEVDLLKIDTEGSEYEVLQVSKQTIQMAKYILIEVSINRTASGDIFDIIHFLKETSQKIKLLKIGRVFTENDKTVAVDLFFSNI